MEGLISEGEEAVESTEDGSMTRDVAIIVACQKVEHYEIATYGSLVQLARTMGNKDVANVLEATLKEEKETDLLLTLYRREQYQLGSRTGSRSLMWRDGSRRCSSVR